MIIERRKLIENDMIKKMNTLSLLSELVDDNVKFNTFNTDYHWDVIIERESKGDEFMDFDEMDGYYPISLTRTLNCSYCGQKLKIDLEDYGTDSSSDENNMGSDIVYYFDSEDSLECPLCAKRYQVTGWIREYPLGAYDSEEINIVEIGEDYD